MATPESAQINIWILIVSSAAIGAVVSSVITELGRWRERRSRREELALTKAFEMAKSITDMSVQIMPMNDTIATAYVTLKHILAHDRLDPAAQKEVDEEYRQHGIK